jgi:hypothetical protein
LGNDLFRLLLIQVEKKVSWQPVFSMLIHVCFSPIFFLQKTSLEACNCRLRTASSTRIGAFCFISLTLYSNFYACALFLFLSHTTLFLPSSSFNLFSSLPLGNRHKPGSIKDLRLYVPEDFVKSKAMERALLAEYAQNAGSNELTTKYKYIQVCQRRYFSLKTYVIFYSFLSCSRNCVCLSVRCL